MATGNTQSDGERPEMPSTDYFSDPNDGTRDRGRRSRHGYSHPATPNHTRERSSGIMQIGSQTDIRRSNGLQFGSNPSTSHQDFNQDPGIAGDDYPPGSRAEDHYRAYSDYAFGLDEDKERNRKTPVTLPISEPHFMEDHQSYHGNITGDEAVRRLKMAKVDAYLTRFSSRHGRYMITVFKPEPSKTIGNFKLVIDKKSQIRKYAVEGMERSFQNIDLLLVYYESNRIHPIFDNIGRRFTVQSFIEKDHRCRIL